MNELMLLLRVLTACYAGEMNVPHAVEVKFRNLHDDWLAVTEVDADYLRATIVYDLSLMSTIADSTVRKTVVHELMHVMTWELVELAEALAEDLAWRLDEQLATRIERMDIWQDLCLDTGEKP